jgi:hypothetical protein
MHAAGVEPVPLPSPQLRLSLVWKRTEEGTSLPRECASDSRVSLRGERLAYTPWAEAFRSALVAMIVLNQLVGPPLMRHALRSADETGRRATLPADKLAEHLTRQLTDTKKIAAICAAAASAAAAFPSAVAGAAGSLSLPVPES